MIFEIVDNIVTQLATLSFKDILVGIAKPLKINDNGTVKTVPAIYNDNPTACQVGSYYLDLVPNSGKKSIIYFEEQGTSIVGYTRDYIGMSSNIVLVCWYNYKKINTDLHRSTLLIGNILKLMPDSIANLAYISGIKIEFIEEIEKTPAIFSRYSYNEAEHQYLTYPYDYFALKFNVTFRVTPSCVPDISENTTEC